MMNTKFGILLLEEAGDGTRKKHTGTDTKIMVMF